MQSPCALAAAGSDPAPPALRDQFAARWDVYAPALLQALDVRARERGTSLGRALEERADKEVRDSGAILTELRKTILAELHQPDVVQLSLFSDPEREQLARNIDSLRARVEQIPAEIDREAAAIRARYATPQTRLFPVAVTFLVPERLARKYLRG